MTDARTLVFIESLTLPAVATAEGRWLAWQQRGVEQDLVSRRRLSVLAAFIALALTSMFTRIALGGY